MTTDHRDLGLPPELLHALKRQLAQSPRGKTRQLYLFLFDALTGNRLRVDSSLPPSREFAQALGVGRNCVINAYQQLSAEGLLVGDRRRGTRIAAQPERSAEPAAPRADKPIALSARALKLTARAHAQTLSPGEPDPTLFPGVALRRALTQASRQSRGRWGYCADAGAPELRAAISRFLASHRALDAAPEELLITASTRQSLAVCATLFSNPGEHAWAESPGYVGAAQTWGLSGLALTPMAVDAQGLVLDAAAPTPKLIYTTPCFQYPTGAGLSPGRRQQLLAFAARHNCVIFEDDYDSEFRDQDQPRPALSGLAEAQNACVLHAGTFSKLMFPAVRLGWLRLPVAVMPQAVGVLRSLGGGHNSLMQAAVASLLDNGTLANHLVRARGQYRLRRQALIQALAGSGFSCRAQSGGLSLIVDLPAPVCQRALEQALAQAEIGAQPLGDFYWQHAPQAQCHALVLGLGNVALLAIEEAVARLVLAWRQADRAPIS